MGIGGISIWQLLIILVIVLLLFGTKRLRGLGGDLGGAIKGFKKAIKEEDKEGLEKDQASEEGAEPTPEAAGNHNRTNEELKQKSDSSHS